MNRNKLFIAFFVLFQFGFNLVDARAATINGPDYSLGAGDVIEISVYQQPDLTSVKTLSNGGEISFPTVGVVKLAGQTLRDAEKLLSARLRRAGIIKNPEVSFRILEYRSSVVSVDGRVNKQGEYPIVGIMTIHELISKAGGLGEGASPLVSLYRRGQPVRQIDLYRIYSSENDNQSYLLRPGDRVLVELAEEQILSEPVFYTYGAITKNGRYPLIEGMTVIQALATSGGLTERASKNKIKITRTVNLETGETTTRSAELTDKVQANDVISVDESRF